jgi:hypothetical protein
VATSPPGVPRDLARAIADTIAYSAGVALAAHGVSQAARLAAEVGNNCAATVVAILEAFLDDGTILATPQKEG